MKIGFSKILAGTLLAGLFIGAGSANASEDGIKRTVYIGGDIAYSKCTNATYSFTGELFNDKPVL